MFLLSPSALTDGPRTQVMAELGVRLCDAVDIYTVFKSAHWNLRGPQFISYHLLLDGFADDALGIADKLAERIAMFGGAARGSARTVARLSTIPEYPADLVRDVDHMHAVYGRVLVWLNGLRASRLVTHNLGDAETENMLIEMVTTGEVAGWKLAATIDPATSTR